MSLKKELYKKTKKNTHQKTHKHKKTNNEKTHKKSKKKGNKKTHKKTKKQNQYGGESKKQRSFLFNLLFTRKPAIIVQPYEIRLQAKNSLNFDALFYSPFKEYIIQSYNEPKFVKDMLYYSKDVNLSVNMRNIIYIFISNSELNIPIPNGLLPPDNKYNTFIQLINKTGILKKYFKEYSTLDFTYKLKDNESYRFGYNNQDEFMKLYFNKKNEIARNEHTSCFALKQILELFFLITCEMRSKLMLYTSFKEKEEELSSNFNTQDVYDSTRTINENGYKKYVFDCINLMIPFISADLNISLKEIFYILSYIQPGNSFMMRQFSSSKLSPMVDDIGYLSLGFDRSTLSEPIKLMSLFYPPNINVNEMNTNYLFDKYDYENILFNNINATELCILHLSNHNMVKCKKMYPFLIIDMNRNNMALCVSHIKMNYRDGANSINEYSKWRWICKQKDLVDLYYNQKEAHPDNPDMYGYLKNIVPIDDPRIVDVIQLPYTYNVVNPESSIIRRGIQGIGKFTSISQNDTQWNSIPKMTDDAMDELNESNSTNNDESEGHYPDEVTF